MRGLRYGRGFGHVFGLLFLFRHPLFIPVVALVILAVYFYRRQR